MFPRRYFAGRYFAPSFFAQSEAIDAVPPTITEPIDRDITRVLSVRAAAQPLGPLSAAIAATPKRLTVRGQPQTPPPTIDIPVPPETDDTPNVLIIHADDLGYGDLHCYGNSIVLTPNLDGLASDGVRFTEYRGAPVCSPSRTGLLTGRYPYRNRVVESKQGRNLPTHDVVMLPQVLRDRGYRTSISGKWHLGDGYPYRPIDKGFSDAYWFPHGQVPDNYTFQVIDNGVREQSSGTYSADVFTNRAINQMRDAVGQNKPFFSYVPLNQPHVPLQVPDSYAQFYRNQGCTEETALTYGMIQYFDEQVGRLLNELTALGQAGRTIVVFLSDNGLEQDNGSPIPRFNAGLRGQKGEAFDGGFKVPLIMRWTGRIAAGQVTDYLASHVDIMPTLIDACQIPNPGFQFDGVSLMNIARGERPDWNRFVYTQNVYLDGDRPTEFVNYSVVWQKKTAGVTEQYWTGTNQKIYNLPVDPGQNTDVGAANPTVRGALNFQHQQWYEDMRVSSGDFTLNRIWIGRDEDNPTWLQRGDVRGALAPVSGYWDLTVYPGPTFNLTGYWNALAVGATVNLLIDGVQVATAAVSMGSTSHEFDGVAIPDGDHSLAMDIVTGGPLAAPNEIEVEKI